jgi:hypothetical protein
VTSASNSRDFEGRYELTGNNTVCSIRIKAVQIDEAGEWRCEVSDYDYLLYKRFEVQVAVKATTPTPITLHLSSSGCARTEAFKHREWMKLLSLASEIDVMAALGLIYLFRHDFMLKCQFLNFSSAFHDPSSGRESQCKSPRKSVGL